MLTTLPHSILSRQLPDEIRQLHGSERGVVALVVTSLSRAIQRLS
jgi:hypothetical protein